MELDFPMKNAPPFQDTSTKTSTGARFGAWTSWLVLFLSFLGTGIAWNESRSALEARINGEFNALISETRGKLEERITSYTQVLRSAAALFVASDKVSRENWRNYIAAQELVKNYPALPAVAFARHVRKSELEDFIAEMRKSGVADFAFRPPGEREEYVINSYAEPFLGGNIKALGYDMWQDIDRRITMERAAISSQPMITKRITLKIDEEANPIPAFIMYLPVRLKGEIYGYVLSPFRMPTMLQDLLGRNGEFLTMTIYDGAEPITENLFYRSPTNGGSPLLTTRQNMEIGGQVWTLEFSSRPQLEAVSGSNRPRLVLLIGLIFSLLLFGITWSLVRTKSQAEAMVEEKTRSLKESQALLQGIVDNSSAIIYVKDLSGRHILINAMFEKLLQASKEEVYGRTNADLFPPNIAQSLTDNDNKVRDSATAITAEETIPQPDGPHTYLSVKFPIRDIDGFPTAICGISTNISEQKAAANRIIEINQQLEMQAQQLQRSNSELEQFAYIASHDLQEPLRMLSMYAQLISKRYSEKLDDDAKQFIEYMVDGATRMQTMILDLLELSRIGRREDSLAEIEAKEGVEIALRNLSAAIDNTGAIIECEALPRIKTCPHQFVALMQNLIGNAIKYRHQERNLEIKISARQVGHYWEFSITDNGIGIHPDFFDKIFLIFQRLHTRDMYEGSGIGLAICKKIVEQHNGQIWVESAPTEGCMFFFTLPAIA
jgi:PAS domain S-box-containing protein